nr:MAG TPA_asm: hypothetical protein [Caudoviricetes sp.]
MKVRVMLDMIQASRTCKRSASKPYTQGLVTSSSERLSKTAPL